MGELREAVADEIKGWSAIDVSLAVLTGVSAVIAAAGATVEAAAVALPAAVVGTVVFGATSLFKWILGK